MFLNYAPEKGVYDELLDASGETRNHWLSFVNAVDLLDDREFNRRWRHAQRTVHEHGFAFSPFGDRDAHARPWSMDPLPLLIPQVEWQTIAAALKQRAVLLEKILADLYGPQDLLRRRLLPAELVFGHPGFLRPYHGVRSPDGRHLHCYAADLSRAPDGKWWVLADRTEAPSGAGFALENRIVISRMLPGIFHGCHVARLAPYFIALQEMLQRLATRQDNPRTVLFSQGPSSVNYFEDAYLARYLGYPLVVADDLDVREDGVKLKTLGGLLPVDVLLRRPNSEACDPLELNRSSTTGVPELLQTARQGRVAVANMLGSGLVESPVFMAFLPKLCAELLGEPLKLPNVATWWCGAPAALEFTMAHLDRLTIKRAFRHRGEEFERAQEFDNMTKAELAATIQAAPAMYVAQEKVERSSTPVWRDGEMTPSRVSLRTFLVASGDSFTVMQGGLARVCNAPTSLEVSLRAGEGTKDIWVLSDAPVAPVSLLEKSGTPVVLRRSGAELPSRLADNFFWLGRHLERADGAARLLRTIGQRLTGEVEPSAISELPNLLRVLAEQGQIEPGFVLDQLRVQLPAIEKVLPQAVFEENQLGSLRSIVNRLFRASSIVRDRMSLDTWRVIQHFHEHFRPPSNGPVQLIDMLSLVGSLIIELSALSGMITESMTRTQGWRFLNLGRRLERALHTTSLVRHALLDSESLPTSLLEAVLEVSESIMTYRARYLANFQLAPVLDLLLTDETNPRSVAFQLVSLVEHVEKLPRFQSQPLHALEQQLAMRSLHEMRMVDFEMLTDPHDTERKMNLCRVLDRLNDRLPKLSNVIVRKYLIHIGASHQLAELRPN